MFPESWLSTDSGIEAAIETIRTRALDSGGFSAQKGGHVRPDITAWAVLALEACRGHNALANAARKTLLDFQMSDGRVPLAKPFPIVYWPTSLAVLAWTNAPEYTEARRRACEFLLASSGAHWMKKPIDVVGHDTSIRGWTWIDGTHSWVPPTAMAVLALTAGGYGESDRVTEAVRMLMDRQTSAGGWNYGNTTVFGRETKPFVETTGNALDALAGHVQEAQVQRSIEYLAQEAVRARTPLTLSSAILGLGAWSRRPPQAQEWLLESINLQERYGPYDTDLLSRIVVAFHAKKGLLSVYRRQES
jgi:hypothetical protein